MVGKITTELSRRVMLDSDANEVSEHVERASRRLERLVRWNSRYSRTGLLHDGHRNFPNA